jgi:general secretion pathway protein D
LLRAFRDVVVAGGGDVSLTENSVSVVGVSGEGKSGGIAGPLAPSGGSGAGFVVDWTLAREAAQAVRVSGLSAASAFFPGADEGLLLAMRQSPLPVSGSMVAGGLYVVGSRDAVDAARAIWSLSRGEVAAIPLGAGGAETVAALQVVMPSAQISFDATTSTLFVRSDVAAFRDLASVIWVATSQPLSVGVQVSLIDWQATKGRAIGLAVAGPATGSLSDGTIVFSAGAQSVVLDALDRSGSASVIASPSAVVLSGAVGRLVSGDQVPITTDGVDSDGRSYSSTEYRDTGVVLDVTPRVMSDGTIEVLLSVELTVPDGNDPPTFKTRSASTTLRVTDGQTVLFGGLSLKGIDRRRSGLFGPAGAGLGGVISSASVDSQLYVVVTLSKVPVNGSL